MSKCSALKLLTLDSIFPKHQQLSKMTKLSIFYSFAERHIVGRVAIECGCDPCEAQTHSIIGNKIALTAYKPFKDLLDVLRLDQVVELDESETWT